MSDSDSTADFVTIISTELIAEVMQRYFNDELYKRRVEIVDSKATSDGYMFSLAFVTEPTEHPTVREYGIPQIITDDELEMLKNMKVEYNPITPGNGRDSKGKFAPGNKVKLGHRKG